MLQGLKFQPEELGCAFFAIYAKLKELLFEWRMLWRFTLPGFIDKKWLIFQWKEGYQNGLRVGVLGLVHPVGVEHTWQSCIKFPSEALSLSRRGLRVWHSSHLGLQISSCLLCGMQWIVFILKIWFPHVPCKQYGQANFCTLLGFGIM